MIDTRKLAAIDIALLGRKFVLAEYACGVLLSMTLGLFVLLRSHSSSYWQMILGFYFLCLGINYVPMLSWAIAIADKEKARVELGDELKDKHHAMAKYRRVSLVLLVPLLPVVLFVASRRLNSGQAKPGARQAR